MEINKNTYILEYSPSTGNFYVQTLGSMFVKNNLVFMSDEDVDYIPVAYNHSLDEIEKTKNQLIKLKEGQTK